MARFGSTFRVYPGRLVGAFTQYNAEFVSFLKALPFKVWDAETRGWWFPEGMWTAVKHSALTTGAATQSEVDRFERSWASADKAAFSPQPHTASYDDPYAVLGLAPNAPPKLAKLAYEFWMREFAGAGGTDYQQEKVRVAYEQVSGETRETSPNGLVW